MSVIGRLDEQVEAVLINPLKRRRAPGEEAREQQPPTPVPATKERDADPPASPGTRDDDQAAGLPVWLL